MNIKISGGGHLRPATAALLRRMLSPLCGLDEMIGFMTRTHSDPLFITAGAELCGVHLLRKQPRPKPGAHHIGGSGMVLDEAVIRCLGETVERYAQLVSEVTLQPRIVFRSYNRIECHGESVLSPAYLIYFTQAQLALRGFPFQAFERDLSLGWIKAASFTGEPDTWIPAQLLLVGYVPKRKQGEPWLSSAVTTGTAAHTVPELALRNAILELIQIDSVMGHWYSAPRAPEILLDSRTSALATVIRKRFGTHSPPRFYWVRNADLVSFTISCVIRQRSLPCLGVGLGADTRLVPAMYKALLEALGVVQLAKINLFERACAAEGAPPIAPDSIYDLDSNTAYYSQRDHGGYVEAKFGGSDLKASDLPPDSCLAPKQELRMLVDSFRTTGKRLFYLDLTCPDVRELGFVAVRVWSPDTLSLCLPSAPAAAHPRFNDYGGISHFHPHPYP